MILASVFTMGSDSNPIVDKFLSSNLLLRSIETMDVRLLFLTIEIPSSLTLTHIETNMPDGYVTNLYE